MHNSIDQTPATPTSAERVSNFVCASGRTRKAGYWICGGGVAVLLSAFLPWVNVDGMDAVHLSGSGVVVFLALGGLLAYFGSRVLQDRLSKAINVTLWVIAGLDVVLSLAFFANEAQLNRESGGIVSVSPAIGFYLGIGGLIAGVVGTVLVQTVRRHQGATPHPVENGR